MELEKTQAASSSSAYESWEEVYLSNDKGKREVHYYLKKKNGGGLDLAVIGKEKTLRHMSYHYAFRDRSLFGSENNSSSISKLRSRREVVDWLNSIIHPDLQPHLSIEQTGGYVDRNDGNSSDINIIQDVERQKLGQHTKEFMWLGSPWTCRKRRRHYQSFCRNGVEISVHDFVYVLAEEDERLVAHLDDMYEDSKGNNMVVVRWFHKIDEVGIVLPRNYNDREIFFSLCLQDLSIECIDGLSTVLSPQHYEKFLNEAKYTQLEPFVCRRQFDNDEVKPLDITQVKGYWKQDALRYMSSSPSKSQPSDDGLRVEGNPSDASDRPKKRCRWSQECDTFLQSASGQLDICASFQDRIGSSVCCIGAVRICSLKEGRSAASMWKTTIEQKHEQHLTIGSEVEVLSQDSGIRGCWFRALIVKKHKNKVKVQYQDIKDATDDAKNLEEWVLASRLAAADDLGIRICGRTIVRPVPCSKKGKVSWVFNVGTLVDVGWNNGWWEGIVVKKESKEQLRVYFPGEKQELTFGCGELRHSQEWLENEWKQLKERPDIVSVLSGVEMKQHMVNCSDVKPEKAASSGDKDILEYTKVDLGDRKLNKLKVVRDLSKDDLLSKLRWKSSRRRRVRSPVHKVHYALHDRTENRVEHAQAFQRFFMPSSFNVDPDNCKYISDSLFNSSAVSPFTNLVMSR